VANNRIYIVRGFIYANESTVKRPIKSKERKAALNEAAAGAFQPIPAEYLKTLTADNGKEFLARKALDFTPLGRHH
jgi:IS30 family transposase